MYFLYARCICSKQNLYYNKIKIEANEIKKIILMKKKREIN